MRRLLEVDVREAVVANVVIIDQAECSTGSDGLDKFGRSIDVRTALDVTQGLVGARRSLVAVLGGLLQAVRVEVNRPAPEPRLVLLGRVAMGGQRCTEKAEQQQ